MTVKTFNHWRCEIDEHKIFWATIDRADKSVNTMSLEVMSEFNGVLDLIDEQPDVIGVVIKNGKKNGFIAGADISEFTGFQNADDAISHMRSSQDTCMRLENLKVPSIALIDGFALGGGYEIALSCTYRVALDSPKVRVGLPETLLGIHPGWAGTIRLPRLIGGLAALPLIMAGRTLNVRKAKKQGLIDDIVRSKLMLDKAAIYYLTNKPKPHSPNWIGKISNWGFVRPLLAKQIRAKAEKKVNKEHYPAPFAVIDIWEKHGTDVKAGQIAEAQSMATLFSGRTAPELVRIFFLRDRLKSLGKKAQFECKHVHVIGAGVMGGDIAAVCVLSGMTVTLQDREEQFIAPAIKRAHKLFKRRTMYKRDAVAAMDRLLPDVHGRGVHKADVVIEAIFENAQAKQALYKELEPKMKKGAILATNTSTIPLEELSSVLKSPERLVGIHFFNPVPKMQLVEVVKGEKSGAEQVQNALSFVTKIGKLPLPVKSSPAFLINRILMPYMMEAFTLYDEGVAPAAIDKAAVDFGMPIGPIELADVVGLDVAISAGKTMQEHFGGETPKILEDLVSRGHYGKKTGTGFYTYRDGKPVKVSLYQQGEVPADLTDRLMLRMVNESVACLDEKVVEDSDLLDAGMIFGTGFAPFRGGPMQYANHEGSDKIVKRLEKLADKHGDRFKPHKGWKKLSPQKSKQKATEK